MLSLAASQRTVQQPPARGAAYYLRACSRALGALLDPAALLAVLPYAGGHALGCQRLLDSLGPGRGSEGRLKAASCCSTDASSRCRCARRPRCVGCQAAESNEADPGSAKNGRDTKCTAQEQRGQRHRTGGAQRPRRRPISHVCRLAESEFSATQHTSIKFQALDCSLRGSGGLLEPETGRWHEASMTSGTAGGGAGLAFVDCGMSAG